MKGQIVLGECFNPAADIEISNHCRPHWSQSGTVVFITFRLHDSIPKDVLLRWEREKEEWLWSRGYRGNEHWSSKLKRLSEAEQIAFNRQFDRVRESFLDTCHGRCVLRQPAVAEVVADSLLYFDNQRYRMGDFIVMPNHVHLLAVFGSPTAMRDQCDSWMHYTAFRINRMLGEKGKLWQQEPFDHLVRSPEQYVYLREYIKNNSKRARIGRTEYLYRRYQE